MLSFFIGWSGEFLFSYYLYIPCYGRFYQYLIPTFIQKQIVSRKSILIFLSWVAFVFNRNSPKNFHQHQISKQFKSESAGRKCVKTNLTAEKKNKHVFLERVSRLQMDYFTFDFFLRNSSMKKKINCSYIDFMFCIGLHSVPLSEVNKIYKK